MTCLTREGTAYVLEVDKQSLLVLLQREYETIPVQVRSDGSWPHHPVRRAAIVKRAGETAARRGRAATATPAS